MKLIVDIPEGKYKKLKEYFANDDCGLPNDLAIAKGIPLEEELEKIKEEILEENRFIWYPVDIKDCIDKHISKLKGE